MKFYDRDKELNTLAESRDVAFSRVSQMTVLTGRRRIGKTKLMLKSCEGTPTVYLFVSRSSEPVLCRQFSQVVRDSLDVFVPNGIETFRDLFRLLMELGKQQAYNLIIDEFQELEGINSAVFSDIQNIWDSTKDEARVNLLISGSVYSLMHHLFMDYKEPLYGRATSIIRMKPFAVSVLKKILHDHSPEYTNDDLLALYMLTGGVPKYVELLIDSGAFSVKSMIDRVVKENSVFIEEGNVMLIQEFGKKYGNYYAILSAIASGANETSRISDVTGQQILGGSLQRLEEDYGIITKLRPVKAKEGTQTVKYEIKDHFLRFWFRYIVKYQNLVQSGRFEDLRSLVMRDYADYSGHVLEAYFRDKIAEENSLEQIGSWWEGKRGKGEGTDQHEIDIVAVFFKEKRVLLAEVKRQRKNFDAAKFEHKVELIKTKLFARYKIETACLTLDEM